MDYLSVSGLLNSDLGDKIDKMDGMKTDDWLKRQSEAAGVMRWPLTVLVVLSHSVLIRENTPIEFSLSGENIFLAAELLARSMGALAVCCFAYISGYYFFLKAKPFDADFYLNALKKRVRSLLVPYLLWNLLAIVIFWAKNVVALKVGFAPGYSSVEAELVNGLSIPQLLLLPIDSPLWYIRELCYLMVLSPLVAWGLKYGKVYFLVAVWLAYLFNVPYVNHIVAYFVLGAYLAISSGSIILWVHKGWWFWLAQVLLFVVVVLWQEKIPYYEYLSPLSQFGVFMVIFGVCDGLVRSRSYLAVWFDRMGDAAFFVYALHAIVVLGMVRGFLYLLLPSENPWVQLSLLPLVATLTTVITYGVYRLMKWVSPSLLGLLTGGRS